MKSLALVVSLLTCLILHSTATTQAAPSPVVAAWSQPFGARLTWSQANSTAANLVEGGYTDWRLPTRAELQAAIQSGSLPTLTPNTGWFHWTSERQGNRAWVVTLVTDANGDVIPSLSGATSKQLQVSLLAALGTRP